MSDTYGQASLSRKMLGLYNLPDGTAHIRGILSPWMRIAVVFIASGTLDVGEENVTFTSTPFKLFGWVTRNVRKDLTFTYSRPELVSIEAADFSSPVLKWFDLPFTRVRTTLSAPLDNFLVCIGGRIAMPSIRKSSLELRDELYRFAGTK